MKYCCDIESFLLHATSKNAQTERKPFFFLLFWFCLGLLFFSWLYWFGLDAFVSTDTNDALKAVKTGFVIRRPVVGEPEFMAFVVFFVWIVNVVDVLVVLAKEDVNVLVLG